MKTHKLRGFSLFELMVYILMASILFAVAANRYRQYPAEAERANFIAVMTQLKAGVNLQMMRMIANADWTQERRESIEGSNPMALMLETPSNYLGELTDVDISTIPPRVWFFDTEAGELVYVAENFDKLYVFDGDLAVNTNLVRLRIENVYDLLPPTASDNNSDGARWQGLVLRPIQAFQWQSVAIGQSDSTDL